MNLFINAVSEKWYLALFDKNRNIIASIDLDIKWNESSQFITTLDTFLHEHNTQYSQIQNIVCVNGPGSFTGVRTIVLVVNSLGFLHDISLTHMSYFDLFNNFPVIKSSSRRDSFFLQSAGEEIKIIQNSDLEQLFIQQNKKEIYWESNFSFENVSIIENIDYSDIIEKLEFQKHKKIEALYIKKPNIS